MPTDKKTKQKTVPKKTTVKKTSSRKTTTKRVPAKNPRKRSTSSFKLALNLDAEGKALIEKLCKWTKFVGIMNIITGVMYCLTIFIFSLPTVAMGIITILMGSKLTIASDHLRYASDNKDDKSFQIALDQLGRYFVINGALFILTLVFVLILLLMASMFAGIFIEILNEFRFIDSPMNA